ncbi:MAG: hypothetical protein JNL58_05100 [Planctomyces sp.]|nr:hypothetical protein [Planctomyces sp.]
MDTSSSTLLQRVSRSFRIIGNALGISSARYATHSEVSSYLHQHLECVAADLNWPAWSPRWLGVSSTGSLLFRLESIECPSKCIAIGRYASHTSMSSGVAEPSLPRILLNPAAGIERESRVYQSLAHHGLTPRLLFADTCCLVNEYVDAERLSDVLRRDPEQIWLWLPKVLDAISAMHRFNEHHLDLNCGNILVQPTSGLVRFVDFEYEVSPEIELPQSQSFDYVRFLHGVLKRRRGEKAIQRDPTRFLQVCRTHIPSEIRRRAMTFPAAVLGRTLRYSTIFET